MKPGDSIVKSIDQAIHISDKILLILSEYSITSSWTKHEVEAALEKEHVRQQTVLIPIRLDDAAMESTKNWASQLRRTRHIGDFTKWKDHEVYKQAFDGLLRALHADG